MGTIGFIGLGNMGRPMASNLCRKGMQLVVLDIDPERMRPLEALGREQQPTSPPLPTGAISSSPCSRRLPPWNR